MNKNALGFNIQIVLTFLSKNIIEVKVITVEGFEMVFKYNNY